MSSDWIIHWQEGLFLQPHHLQRMQRTLLDHLAAVRRLAWTHPYGLVEARLSRDELRNFRLRFERLHAVLPSGAEVRFPGNADLPSVDLKPAFARVSGSLAVYLAVPLWFESRSNAARAAEADDGQGRYRYRVQEIECVDENTGENRQPIQIRKLNARFLLEGEDTADLELLPLLRIQRAAGEDIGLPQEDRDYMPPCLVVGGSEALHELLTDLANAVTASRRELVLQLTRGGFSLDTLRGAQFEQMMRLRTLNHYSARLLALTQVPGVTPFHWYLELRALLGELTALHPDRDEYETAPYDHDQPRACFQELSDKIRVHLRGAVAPSYRHIPFKEVNGVLTVQLGEDDLTLPNAYFLGVKTRQDPRAAAQRVEDADKFKLMPKSKERVAIRGIELKEERHPPLELPAQGDLHYFRLDRTGTTSQRRWEETQKDRALVIVWDPQQAGFWADATFGIYMTLP